MRYMILLCSFGLLFLNPLGHKAIAISIEAGQRQEPPPPEPPPSEEISPEPGGPPEFTDDLDSTMTADATGAPTRLGDYDEESGTYTTHTACGEVRGVDQELSIFTLKRRFTTRPYIVNAATIFSPEGASLETMEAGDRVMISYTTVYGVKIAVKITLHE